MPCRDDGYPLITTPSALKLREAMLCAVLSAVENEGLLTELYIKINADNLNGLTDNGVSGCEISIWWEAHKVKDQARKRAEQLERSWQTEKVRARAAALAKLTPEEKQILNIR